MSRRLLLAALVLLPGIAFGIDFDAIAARIDHVDSVWFASRQVELAELDLREAGYVGDYSLSFTPSGSVAANDDGIRSATVTATASFALPIGLSEESEARVQRAADALVAAERAVRSAREASLARLYRLYQDAWLAQEEIALLDAELEAARLDRDIAAARFDEGAITLVELSASAETYDRALTERDQGVLAHRLAWLELAFAVGLEPSDQLVLDPELAFSAEPPKPPELSEWAASRSTGILAQLELIGALEREIATESARVSLSSTRLQLSAFDHGLSVSYGFASPTVSATYSTPSLNVYPPADSSGSAVSQSTPFSAGISATISLGGDAARVFERDALTLELERELRRLESIRDALDFELRGLYQLMHRSIDAVDQAERTLERAQSNSAVVEARAAAGQVGGIDVSRAAIDVERARFDLVAARIAREDAIMQVVLAASYFDQHYPDFAEYEGEIE